MHLINQYRGLRKENYVLFFGRIVTNMGAMVWPMLTMILNLKLGFNATEVAVILFVISMIAIPAAMIGGKVADKRNKKHGIICCDIVSIMCYVYCGFIPLSRFSVVLIVVAAIFQKVESPMYSALIADLTATKDRDRAYSLSYLGGNIGLMLSPTIAGLLFKDNLRLVFIISGIAIACSTVLIFFKVKDISVARTEDHHSVYQKASEHTGLIEILKKNKVIMLYIITLAIYYSAYGQFSYLMPLDLGRVHGDDGAVIFGTITSVNCIIVVIFTPFITMFFRKLRDTGKILCGTILQIVSFFVFMFLLGHIWAYYLTMMIFTFGEIFTSIAGGPYLSKRVPETHRGRINGLAEEVMTLMAGVTEVGVGELFDRFGSAAAWSGVQIIGAAATALAFILIKKDRIAYDKLYMEAAEQKIEENEK